MPDGHLADQVVQHVSIENLRDQTHALKLAELPAVTSDDAGAFLPAVLEGVETVVGQLGGVRVTVDAEHATVMFGILLHVSVHRSGNAIPPEVVQFPQVPSQLAAGRFDLQLGPADTAEPRRVDFKNFCLSQDFGRLVSSDRNHNAALGLAE